jgi:uncharacterized protein
MHPAFSAYVEPARKRPQLWRLVLGLVLATGVYAAWMGAMFGVIWFLAGGAPFEDALSAIGGAGSPLGMILILFTFLGMGMGAWAAARALHGRGLRSLLGPSAQLWPEFARGAGIMLVVGGGLGVVVLVGFADLTAAMPLSTWAMFLPLALLAVAIQTGAEELIFRGYLQQQLAALSPSPLGWLVLPSVLFGLAHYSPDQMGDNALLIVAATGMFGFIAADLTARSGGLGLAWGLHFANNVLALLFVSAMGGLNGLALFSMPVSMADSMMRSLILADMAILFAVWLACRFWLMRRAT